MAVALKNWINREVATTLAAGITNVATTLTVASGASFPASGTFRIQIDAGEQMDVTAGQGTTTWTVTRGVGGTTAAAHLTGAVVVGYTPVDRDGLRDLETRLGAYRDAHSDDAAAHGGGRELAYAERTSDLAYSGTGTWDVYAAGSSGAALTIGFVAGLRPIWLFARVPFVSINVALEEVVLQVTDPANALVAYGQIVPSAGGSQVALTAERRLGVLTNGQSYSYKLRHNVSGQSGSLHGNALWPIFLTAIER